MIWNYGLHWHVDRVWWGSPSRGDAGLLYGATNRNAPEGQVVDFREQIGIYALYADYELVYVGQAGTGGTRLFNRLNAHRSDHLSERWDRFSWFGARGVDDSVEGGYQLSDFDSVSEYTGSEDTEILMTSAVNILEAVSIAISEPRLNLQRGNWKTEGILQFYQWWDNQWWEE